MQYEYIFKKLSKMVRKLFSNGIWIVKNSKKKILCDWTTNLQAHEFGFELWLIKYICY
jgi:hypothetical protein